MVQPPDGHWHRRTPKPVAEQQVAGHGLVEKYECTEPDCGWAVYDPARGAEWYPAHWNRLTPLGRTKQMYAEKRNPVREAKAKKVLAAAEVIADVLPEDPE